MPKIPRSIKPKGPQKARTPDKFRNLRLTDFDEDGLIPFSPEAVVMEMEHGDPGFHKD